MEFDVNKMDRIRRNEKNNDIFKSKYLKEDVPVIHFEEGDLYCIPVDGSRIYDPLFYQNTYIVGTIVGYHIRSKNHELYQTENDGSKMDSDETDLYKRVGTTAITKTYLDVPTHLYSDGKHAYLSWWAYLVRIDYMILANPYLALNYTHGEINNLLRGFGNEEIWDVRIKPHLTDKKPILSMLVNNAKIKAHEITIDLNSIKRKSEYANKVYDELNAIMGNINKTEDA